MSNRGKRLPDGCTLIRQGGVYVVLDPKGNVDTRRSGRPVQKTR